MTQTISLPNLSALKHYATKLATCLRAPVILGFQGALGAGKTTLVREILRAAGVEGPIQSPTYSIVINYDTVLGAVFHFDLYRIADEEELECMGIRDFFHPHALCFIEWPECAPSLYQQLDVLFTLDFMEEGRMLTCCAKTDTGQKLLTCIAEIP